MYQKTNKDIFVQNLTGGFYLTPILLGVLFLVSGVIGLDILS